MKYNRERQAAITQEITEIVGGAAALNNNKEAIELENKGTIYTDYSPVVDVAFKDKLPNIYNALKVKVDDKELSI